MPVICLHVTEICKHCPTEKMMKYDKSKSQHTGAEVTNVGGGGSGGGVVSGPW